MKWLISTLSMLLFAFQAQAQCEIIGVHTHTLIDDQVFVYYALDNNLDYPIASVEWNYWSGNNFTFTQTDTLLSEFIVPYNGETIAEVCVTFVFETPNGLCEATNCFGIHFPCPTLSIEHSVVTDTDGVFTLEVNASGGSGNYAYTFNGWPYQTISANGNTLVGNFDGYSSANVGVVVDDLGGGACINQYFQIPLANPNLPCLLEVVATVNENVVEVDFIMFNGTEQAIYPAVNINWGDGSALEVSELYSNSIHSYASQGTYEICLSGLPFFEDACLAEECVTIEVVSIDQECSASFNGTVTPWGYASFINTSSGYYTDAIWTASNGQTSTGEYLSIENVDWPLTVTLNITNSETGCSSSYSETFDYSNASVNVCGTVFADDNDNGVFDDQEQGLPNIQLIAISSTADTLYVTTDAEGHYCITVPVASNYFLYPQSNGQGGVFTPFFASLFYTGTNETYTQNFGLSLPSGVYDASVNCYGYVWVSNVQGGAFYVQLHNLTDMPFTGEFSAECGEDEIFVYSSVSGNFSADQRTFSAPITLAPFETLWVYMSVEVDPSVPLGTIQHLSTSFSSALDVQPLDNTCTSWHEVIGSYDPNNKVAVPSGEGEYGHIPPGTDEIVYTINCQNTGTAPAYSVVITDVFEAPLVVEGLETLHSSHPVTMVVNGNQVDWVFDNIVLPDSTTNEPESHCSVTFRVSIDPTLPVGTTIANSAAIYFDANEPIITNTKLHTIFEEEVSVEENNVFLQVYPNPITDRMFIRFNQPSAVVVYDAMGREVYTESIQRSSFEVATENWSSGIYMIKHIESGKCLKVIK